MMPVVTDVFNIAESPGIQRHEIARTDSASVGIAFHEAYPLPFENDLPFLIERT